MQRQVINMKLRVFLFNRKVGSKNINILVFYLSNLYSYITILLFPAWQLFSLLRCQYKILGIMVTKMVASWRVVTCIYIIQGPWMLLLKQYTFAFAPRMQKLMLSEYWCFLLDRSYIERSMKKVWGGSYI